MTLILHAIAILICLHSVPMVSSTSSVLSVPSWYAKERSKLVSESQAMRFDHGPTSVHLDSPAQILLNRHLITMKEAMQNTSTTTFIGDLPFAVVKDK